MRVTQKRCTWLVMLSDVALIIVLGCNAVRLSTLTLECGRCG